MMRGDALFSPSLFPARLLRQFGRLAQADKKTRDNKQKILRMRFADMVCLDKKKRTVRQHTVRNIEHNVMVAGGG